MNKLSEIIDEYRAKYGEPEYSYSKKRISWSKFRRQPGYHSTPIGDGEPVTKDEYDANIEESKRLVIEAFRGRYPQSYWRYDMKLSKDGWREALIKDVQNA